MTKSKFDIIDILLENKAFRDQMCSTYTVENEMITEDIIKNFNLKRFEHKYILKDRMYNENSYSKKKIRFEESIFILLCSILEPFVHNIEKQLLIHDNFNFDSKYENIASDKKIYQLLSLDNHHLQDDSAMNLVFTKSEIYRIDILENLICTKKIREQILERHFKFNLELVTIIVNNYNLKWINDKYISKVKNHDDTHYARTKLANEEKFLIKKIILFTTWNTSQRDVRSIYYYVEKLLLNFSIAPDKLNEVFNEVSEKYYNLYINHTLPMNQILEEIIKSD